MGIIQSIGPKKHAIGDMFRRMLIRIGRVVFASGVFKRIN